MANKQQNRQKAVGYGYVIADEQGRIARGEFRSNRSDAWRDFLGLINGIPIADEIKKAKKEGFRCVPGFFCEIGTVDTEAMIEQRVKREIRREIEKRISLNPDERDAIGVIEDYLNEL